MTEFIGSRISLISKRDIRYVGTLHEISSEHSTVALEQVVSYGTEGRRPEDEVPPSDNVYEYIVFRGSDVKDLRIEEPPKENQPLKPPQVPDDPAILGSARRPTPSTPQAPTQAAPQQQQQPSQPQQQQQQQQQQRQPQPPQFPQQPPFPYYYGPPPNQRFGPQGFPPGPGFPGMPYGAPPPGWYPPPGHGFPPPPGQFHPGQMPIGPPGQQLRQQEPQPPQNDPNGPPANKEQKVGSQQPSPAKPVATVKLPSKSTTPIPPAAPQKAPTPPAESKPDVAAALAPPASAVNETTTAPPKPVPTGPKSGRIMPAIPLPSPGMKVHVPVNGPLQSTSGNAVQSASITAPIPPATLTPPSQAGTKSIEDANRDARAAVAAAMAKLPPAPGQK
ncbi:hypothetical protein MMC08_006385, partial [Hypocenomyce scalaris]|nr:hypothetical protein [Hypocenomyce scalaris]